MSKNAFLLDGSATVVVHDGKVILQHEDSTINTYGVLNALVGRLNEILPHNEKGVAMIKMRLTILLGERE